MKDRDEVVWETIPTEPRRSSVRWKRYLGECCPHELPIVLVDGTHVRNHFDSDFSQGGNGYRYNFVPKRELWIDRQIDPDEWAFIAYHECQEVERMKKGMSYGPAHDQAKRLEDRFRKIALRRQALTQRAHGRVDKGEPPSITPETYLKDAREACPLCGRPADDIRDRTDPREWTGTGGLLTFRSCKQCHYELYLDN